MTIEVAPADALLAMKLKASRPGRDTDDIRQLLAICGIDSAEAADALSTEFFPGDSLTDRAWVWSNASSARRHSRLRSLRRSRTSSRVSS